MGKKTFGVIASIAVSSRGNFTRALAFAKKATSIEVRLDTVGGSLDDLLNDLPLLIPDRPVILTLRSAEQGGSRKIPLETQWSFWQRNEALIDAMNSEQGNFYVDWGLDLLERFRGERPPFPWDRIGCSWHDFARTPANLSSLLTRLQATDAQAFLKLVTRANTPDDIRTLLSVFKEQIDLRPVIAFAMGKRGRESRFTCLRDGFSGTYGFVNGSAKTAPGQPSIDELLADPRVQEALKS